MPFQAVPSGKKRRVVVEIRGPRDEKQQKRFKAALQKLLKQNNAAVKKAARAKKRKSR